MHLCTSICSDWQLALQPFCSLILPSSVLCCCLRFQAERSGAKAELHYRFIVFFSRLFPHFTDSLNEMTSNGVIISARRVYFLSILIYTSPMHFKTSHHWMCFARMPFFNPFFKNCLSMIGVASLASFQSISRAGVAPPDPRCAQHVLFANRLPIDLLFSFDIVWGEMLSAGKSPGCKWLDGRTLHTLPVSVNRLAARTCSLSQLLWEPSSSNWR